MGIRDWDIVTSYVDSVTTTLKTVAFPKVQEQVKVKNQGNANLTYTIGSQSGTLTPGQSITVDEDISSFTIQAASGTQAFELRAKEKGTEQTETESDIVTFGKPVRANTIVLIGDSITEQNLSVGGYYSGGSFVNANILMNQKFNILKIAGVGGETIEQIASRITTDVIRYKPQFCFVFAGTNNVNDTAKQIIDKLRNLLWKPILDEGITLITATIMPRNTDSLDRKSVYKRVNEAIRNEALVTNNMICVDFEKVVTDYSSDLWRVGYSNDGVHPNTIGAMAMAREIKKMLNDIPMNVSSGYSGSRVDPSSFSPNPMALGNNAGGTNGFVLGTGATGTGSYSWKVSGTATTSVVCTGDQARIDGSATGGKALKLDITYGANNDVVTISPFAGGADLYLDDVWASSKFVKFGGFIKPTTGRNGYLYKCINPTGGQTGTTQPIWPTTLGATVTDGSATWICVPDMVSGGIYQAEAELYFANISSGAIIYPQLEVTTWDSSYVRINNYGINGDVETLQDSSSVFVPKLVTQGTAGSDYFPLNELITVKSPLTKIGNGVVSHIRFQLTITGQNGNTVTAYVQKIHLRKVNQY